MALNAIARKFGCQTCKRNHPQPSWTHPHARVRDSPGVLCDASDMDDLRSRIREHAFQLWEAAGCPEDRAEEFWLRAEQVETGTSQPAERDVPLDPAKFAGF
jgi:hypothetical protein